MNIRKDMEMVQNSREKKEDKTRSHSVRKYEESIKTNLIIDEGNNEKKNVFLKTFYLIIPH